MMLAGRYKIALINIENAAISTHNHFNLTFYNHTALIKRMFVPHIFFSALYLHAYHNQIIPDDCFAGDAGSKLFQLQCIQIPKRHVTLL